jgi:hypothetical protein
MKDVPEILNAITDVVLAYKPKAKTKAQKKRKRKKTALEKLKTRGGSSENINR